MAEQTSDKNVSTKEWLRGGGNPSVSELASALAKADLAIARAHNPANGKIDRNPIPLSVRTWLYEFFFLAIRFTIFIVVYGIGIVLAVMFFSYFLFG